MLILERPEEYCPSPFPLVLTIGNFDGVHRGHLAILRRTQLLAGPAGESTVVTFRNHPSEVLRPHHPVPLICTLAHKIRLLESCGIHQVLLLPFTHDLARQSAASFIAHLHPLMPFAHLILGRDATLGHDRLGTPEVMQALGKKWNFTLHYEAEHCLDEEVVSSTSIREAIKEGNFARAQRLLGRPYSIYSTVSRGEGRGTRIGFRTANLEVEGLCLPPLGVYAVEARDARPHPMRGVANLGLAPTLRDTGTPLLEVHLFDVDEELYGRPLEIFFKSFIRPEKKFSTLEALRQQIIRDVEYAKRQNRDYP